MTNLPLNLPRRAYDHYRRHGLQSLIDVSSTFFSRRLLERQAVNLSDLKYEAYDSETVWYAEQEDWITIPPPSNPTLRAAFAEYPATYHPGQTFVCALDDCHLVGANAVALHRGRKLIFDTTRNTQTRDCFESYPRVAEHILKSTLGFHPTYTDQQLFPLICPSPSYYHWLVEFVPKLRLLELYEHKTGTQPTVLVEQDPPSFVLDSLALAGYDADSYVEWDRDARRVDRLVVAEHRSSQFGENHRGRLLYHPSRANLGWIKTRMREQLPAGTINPDADRRIYVSRQQAWERSVINDDELSEELSRRGFERHTLEEYPFEKQVKLFAEADVIVGPHGAGLANMLFADDPLIIELFPETMLEPYFYFMAKMLEFEYEGIVTAAEENNLLVDIDALSQRMDALGL